MYNYYYYCLYYTIKKEKVIGNLFFKSLKTLI